MLPWLHFFQSTSLVGDAIGSFELGGFLLAVTVFNIHQLEEKNSESNANYLSICLSNINNRHSNKQLVISENGSLN